MTRGFRTKKIQNTFEPHLGRFKFNIYMSIHKLGLVAQKVRFTKITLFRPIIGEGEWELA